MSRQQIIEPDSLAWEGGGFQIADVLPRPPITTVDDWREFLAEEPLERPSPLTMDELRAADESTRRRYNAARYRYHGRFGPLRTPQFEAVHDEALRLARLNYSAAPGARPGVALDGLGTTGKSTISLHIGAKWERLVRRRFSITEELPNGNRFIPVVYVTLPASVTVKEFNRRVIKFFHLPVSKHATEGELTDRIIDAARQCGTSMFIVDDIHFVRMTNRGAEGVNNHFKFLANQISATFVYAGINLEGTKLFSEGASRSRAEFSQTKHRFKRFEIRPFEKGSQEFRSLVASFAPHIILCKQPSGALEALADYLYSRTGGFIGALSNLIREGANLAIDNGEERLTRKLLSTVRSDLAAEEHHARRNDRRATR